MTELFYELLGRDTSVSFVVAVVPKVLPHPGPDREGFVGQLAKDDLSYQRRFSHLFLSSLVQMVFLRAT